MMEHPNATGSLATGVTAHRAVFARGGDSERDVIELRFEWSSGAGATVVVVPYSMGDDVIAAIEDVYNAPDAQ